jgi:hypothetical protein
MYLKQPTTLLFFIALLGLATLNRGVEGRLKVG